jgi:hypothetical protein
MRCPFWTALFASAKLLLPGPFIKACGFRTHLLRQHSRQFGLAAEHRTFPYAQIPFRQSAPMRSVSMSLVDHFGDGVDSTSEGSCHAVRCAAGWKVMRRALAARFPLNRQIQIMFKLIETCISDDSDGYGWCSPPVRVLATVLGNQETRTSEKRELAGGGQGIGLSPAIHRESAAQ